VNAILTLGERDRVPRSPPWRQSALDLLLPESGLMLRVQGTTRCACLASRDPVSGSVYAAMLLVFAAMPLWVERALGRSSHRRSAGSPQCVRKSLQGDDAMLELRPTCEHCNQALPPSSLEARICSFECTFCADCVERVLGNVCPNCGGGFAPRPIRPARRWKDEAFLGRYPASTTVRHRAVDPQRHALFAAALRDIAPEQR